MLVEGAISVKACIKNNKRIVKRIYIDKNKKTKDFNYIRIIAKENNILVEEIDREDFLSLNVKKTFGGIVADVTNRKSDSFDNGDIFYLDGIEDPFNLGYIIRTLYAFGIKNILLPLKDYSSMEAQIIKSSAGAYEMANVCFYEDIYEFIKNLKKDNYHIYSLVRSEISKDIFKEKFEDKCLFMIGGEKRGISKKLEELSDKNLFIPYGSDFRNSLNAYSACDVISTLLYKQRNYD